MSLQESIKTLITETAKPDLINPIPSDGVAFEISWYIGTAERPNKLSKNIEIIIPREYISDNLSDGKTSPRFIEKFTSFINNKVSTLDKESDHNPGDDIPTDKWIFPA